MNRLQINRNKGNIYLFTLIIIIALLLITSGIYMYSAIGLLSIKNDNVLAIFLNAYRNNDFTNNIYSTVLGITQFISYIPLMGLLIYIFRKDFISDAISFKKDLLRNLIIIVSGVILCFALTYIVAIIYELFGDTGTSENQETIEAILRTPGFIPMVLGVCITAPFVEEMIFRKLIFGVFEEKLQTKPIVPILVSSISFALIHVLSGNSIIYIFQYLPLAFVITLSYYLSNRNMYVTIIVHMIYNSIPMLLIYVLQWIS